MPAFSFFAFFLPSPFFICSFLLNLFKDLIPEQFYENFNEQSLNNLYAVTKNLMDECNSAVVIHGQKEESKQ